MKQVVTAQTSPVTPITEVDSNHCYGVQLEYAHNRGFIVQEQYRRGNFQVICPEGMTHSNGFCIGVPSDNLSLFIASILKDARNTVYEFDTFIEMARWVAGEES